MYGFEGCTLAGFSLIDIHPELLNQYYKLGMIDYYLVLEVTKDASADEIKSHYRRLAMQWHPDRNKGSKQAEEHFKAISEAYSVLSDPASKAAYDESLRMGTDYRAGQQQGRPEESGAYGPFGFGFGFADGFGSSSGQERAGAFEWASGLSKERASNMFMDEMYNLAIELTMQNIPWRDIAQELIKRGCPESTAREIAKKIETQRKAMVRNRAKPYFIRSALSGALGLGMFATFGGFGILGFIGLIMSLNGGYNLIRAIYFLTTGVAPKGGVM
ncbi:hypothetical protein SPIRO4BDMA_50639 [uncultured spirochete]|uniref:J domain-containing protein n=1 Tax=uncultured spirochete TaxID=156406 RepID=A0A3P3XSK1_9SPIR|nr:hypothetical protein SPIRO4BDMA_50639 [uncultured spirochete]